MRFSVPWCRWATREVAALLACKANVDAVSDSGHTALSMACVGQAAAKAHDPDGKKRARLVSDQRADQRCAIGPVPWVLITNSAT